MVNCSHILLERLQERSVHNYSIIIIIFIQVFLCRNVIKKNDWSPVIFKNHRELCMCVGRLVETEKAFTSDWKASKDLTSTSIPSSLPATCLIFYRKLLPKCVRFDYNFQLALPKLTKCLSLWLVVYIQGNVSSSFVPAQSTLQRGTVLEQTAENTQCSLNRPQFLIILTQSTKHMKHCT